MESLQRIYGISFPDPKMLKEWEKFQEEAKNRDHRKLGRVCADKQFIISYREYDPQGKQCLNVKLNNEAC